MAQSQKIFIVEDERRIARFLQIELEHEGYVTQTEENGERAYEKLMQEDFDLVLLDIMLPGRDGFAICRDIRAKSEVPVLIVSARGEDIDKIRGLGLGADDYITKPFSPGELIARVKSHITRYERVLRQGAETGAAEAAAAPSQELVRGELRIERLSHRVFLGKKELALPNKEYELLTFLAEHPGIVFSKEQLFEHVWGLDAIGDTATVMVHVNRIRSHIEPDPAHPIYIETVWGAGYRFREN